MSEYRIYCLDGAGNISFAESIAADDHDEAIEQARKLKRNGQKCEVWHQRQLIATLTAQDLAS